MIPAEFAARKLPLKFDEARLVEDLDRVLEDEWVAHPFRERGNALFGKGVTHVAVLLAENGAAQTIVPQLPLKQESRESPVLPTPLLERCTYFKEALGRFECEFNLARLLAMDPGVRVQKHIDKMRATHYQLARFHIPIVTNPKAKFFVHGRWIWPRPGECWYIDAAVPHFVRNDGAARRVHLVFDCFVNDFVNELVGFDLTEFRKSQAQEYNRLQARFAKQWQRRETIHEWNTRVKTATRNAVARSRTLARRILDSKHPH
jgi:hypothetical protein